jgi:hypothetical protein
LSVVALFSPDIVLEVVLDWAQEQLHEQLQVLPPLIVFAVLVLMSVTRFNFFTANPFLLSRGFIKYPERLLPRVFGATAQPLFRPLPGPGCLFMPDIAREHNMFLEHVFGAAQAPFSGKPPRTGRQTCPRRAWKHRLTGRRFSSRPEECRFW